MTKVLSFFIKMRQKYFQLSQIAKRCDGILIANLYQHAFPIISLSSLHNENGTNVLAKCNVTLSHIQSRYRLVDYPRKQFQRSNLYCLSCQYDNIGQTCACFLSLLLNSSFNLFYFYVFAFWTFFIRVSSCFPRHPIFLLRINPQNLLL